MRTIFGLAAIVLFQSALFAQANIHSIDFNNFTYSPYCAGESPQRIAVKKGEYLREKQENGYVDRTFFKVFSVKYGDLNGDRKDEAIVLSICNTGGTGDFSEGFIYSLIAGKPVLLLRIPGGDRADGGLRSAAAKNGTLVIESNDAGKDGEACCPQFIVTTRYRLVGGKLAKYGRTERRKITNEENVGP